MLICHFLYILICLANVVASETIEAKRIELYPDLFRLKIIDFVEGSLKNRAIQVRNS